MRVVVVVVTKFFHSQAETSFKMYKLARKLYSWLVHSFECALFETIGGISGCLVVVSSVKFRDSSRLCVANTLNGMQ